LEVGLTAPPGEALIAAVCAVAGVSGVETADRRLVVAAADPAAVTPAVVRALVAAGAEIVEVRARATTLEQVYFEVMGVRPDLDGAA
jgi:hypothetical protein